MPVISIVFGGLLIALGAWGYFPEMKAGTALIPTGFGVALVVCGLLALKPSLLKHAMHAAAAVGLLGFLGAVANFARKAATSADGVDYESKAVRSTLLMGAMCLVFVGFCVNSFIQARRRRARDAAKGVS
jgi:hypothetical protein